MNKLPIYEAVINDNEELGVFGLSFVTYPATETDWLYFEKNEEKVVKFSIDSEEKRVVRGVFMTADTPIYRRNGDYEYYIKFGKETLRQIAERFLKNGYQNNIDQQHDFNYVDGVYLQEMFIKDTEKGINPVNFEDIPDGSLFCQYRVMNDEVWAKVKDGTFKGFSMEGYFDMQESFEDEEMIEIEQLINKIKEKINN